MTTATRTHPELMSKPALIAAYKQAAEAARKWHARYQLAEYVKATTNADREPTLEEVMDEAHQRYVLLGADPDAEQHRHDLIAELDALCPAGRCNRPADTCTTHNQEKTA